MRNLESRSIKTIFFGCIFLLVASVFMIGCGIKGNPMPHGLILPPAVKDLGGSQSAAGNRLAWTLPDAGKGIERVRILRSTLVMDEASCPGCPRDFTLLAEPSLLELAKIKDTEKVEFLDRNIKTGILYSYRIKLCDASGFCGPDSNQVEIKVKISDSGAGTRTVKPAEAEK